MAQHAQTDRAAASAKTRPAARRWLLFIHQLPSQPSNLRVSTWRRLQHIGAMPLKQAVYALPDSPEAREDFEWLKAEVKGAGGDASVFAADNLDPWSDDALIEEFRRSRQEAYDALARDAERALKRARSTRRPRGTRAPSVGRLLDLFRDRLVAIERIDFFGSAGRDRVLTLIRQLEDRSQQPGRSSAPPAAAAGAMTSFKARHWITRPRPGVDRMASAWLIRRFIDPQARFGFAADREAVPEHGVPFDMFGVEFSHRGEGCTFETLCSDFGLGQPVLSRIAAIVHDLDLKDGRYGAPECGTVGAVIEGLRLAYQDDDELLLQGMSMFESLYRSFELSERSTGPRPIAKRKPRSDGGSAPQRRGKRP